jgi:glycosyltransferase involved in cell wall biosynthesis
MKIGIDYHAAFGMPRGNQTYITNLIPWLVTIDDKCEYILYALRVFDGIISQSPNVQLRKVLSSNPVRRLGIELPLYVCADKTDILHTIYINPVWKRCRSVVTIHDILFEHYPELFTKTFVLRSKAFIRTSVKRADRIITISDYSRGDICSTYDIDPNMVVVTPLGVDETFRPITSQETLKRICQKYGIKDPYILFVGRLEPRKNLPALLEAFCQLQRCGYDDIMLVLSGPKDFGYKFIFKEVNRLRLEKRVLFSGPISQEDLPVIMGGSKVFVYPALYEGFGLPVLEAMACGVPVVTSNTSSLPELVGNAGLLIDPFDVESLASGIRRLLSDSALYKELSQRGIERARTFRWKQCAEKTYKVYLDLMR